MLGGKPAMACSFVLTRASRRGSELRRPMVYGWAGRAYNSSTGKELWNFRAGAGVNAPPSTYTVEGKQYVVVGAGGNTQIDFRRGNNIIAFTLN